MLECEAARAGLEGFGFRLLQHACSVHEARVHGARVHEGETVAYLANSRIPCQGVALHAQVRMLICMHNKIPIHI